MKFNLPEIKRGMKIKCLKCGEPILLNDETFTMDFEAEYVICTHCNTAHDVQAYHIHGEEIKESEE